MGCRSTFVDELLNRAFYKLGLIVGRNPGYFVIIPVLLACICITGFQRINYEIDPEYLFSPMNGLGKYERAIVEEHFRVNYSNRFSVGRITRPGRFGHLIIIPKDGSNNILRRVIWDELRQLDDIIHNITAYHDGKSFTYEKICARWLDECFTNDILNLDHIIDSVESRELNLTFPIMFNPVTFDTHLIPVYFGASVVSEDFIIESVPALQLAYFIAVDDKFQDAIGAAWEEAFLNTVGEAENKSVFKHISTARFASRTLELELEENTKTIVPYFSSTFAIMALFSVVTCMMSDWVRSKPWLGLLGNVSAGLATVSAFGLCMYIGIDFIGLNLAAPFLMIGIGIDDTFVMLAAWRRTNIVDPVPERMASTLSEAAVSITITSVTDMISFFIGIISPFPSIQIFCMYSGFAVVFTFIFHLTFFSGCVAISGYCEQGNRHSIICHKVQPLSKSSHRSWFYRIFCTGGVDPIDANNSIDNLEHGCMTWFRDYLAVALNSRPIKALVIILFGLYLIGGLYGLTGLKEGLERRKLSKEDSYSIIFYDREDMYFREFPYRIQVIISGEYNYSNPIIQEQMENLTSALESTSWISSPIYSESWLRSFLAYIIDNQEYLNASIDTEKDFVKTLKELWLSETSSFALDVKFDESNEHIIASRFLIQAMNVSGTTQETNMLKELRQICNDSPLNATVFHPYFIFFDQFELVLPTSIQCMIYGALVMMLISFIFIPNILCCFWVAFCIVSIELGVAGYMAMWDVNLDSISMINLIMCIGFSVDFTAHICYAYMSSKKKNPDDRVKDCLYSLGLPIVQGAISTILGLIALLLAGTYIFLVFFKMVFLVIFIGALHGLFLLPVLLSIFGPSSYSSNNDDDDDDDNDKNTKRQKDFNDSELHKLPMPYVIPHPTLYCQQISPNKIIQKKSPINLRIYKERDLGLGTSEDSNSTESGSSKSPRHPHEEEESEQRHRHYNGWQRSVGIIQSLSQFQVIQAPCSDYLNLFDSAKITVHPGAVATSPFYYFSQHSLIYNNDKIHRRQSESYYNLNHSDKCPISKMAKNV